MTNVTFDKVSLLYDFVEKYLLRDYQGSLEILDKYLEIKNHDKLIDIGGGTGYIAKALRRKTDDVTIIDPARRMLQKVNDPSVFVIQAEGALLPFQYSLFDLGYFINTLHHIHESKQKQVLEETFRILKNQGRLFIIEVWHPDKFSVKLFTKFEDFTVGKAYHISPDKLTSLLQDVGFHDVTTFFPKKHNWKYVAMAIK